MSVDRFHHLSIRPADYEKAVAFYRDVLGWAVSRSWDAKGAGGQGVILSGGGMKMLISEHGHEQWAESRPQLHLDIHDIDARFKTLPPGTHVVAPPEDTPWGTRWFLVRDPDGNLIAFEEMHGSRK